MRSARPLVGAGDVLVHLGPDEVHIARRVVGDVRRERPEQRPVEVAAMRGGDEEIDVRVLAPRDDGDPGVSFEQAINSMTARRKAPEGTFLYRFIMTPPFSLSGKRNTPRTRPILSQGQNHESVGRPRRMISAKLRRFSAALAP